MTKDVQRVIVRIADGQRGHVTRAQLDQAELSRRAIEHLVERGWLIPVHHGVYAVGHRPVSPLDRAAGVLLACGPQAALSHASAATLWGVYPRWHFPLEVSSRLDRRPRGILVHHRAALMSCHVAEREALRVTTPALTLLDIAPRLSAKRRVRAFNELRLQHSLELAEVLDVLERFPRHPGAKFLRPLVLGAADEPTRSPYEDDWRPFGVAYHLPPYAMNQIVCGYRVDVIFLPDLLIVELDGWRTHGTPASFESDRAQDADILARTGIPTIRITYAQFHDDPGRQAARIMEILAARSARAA